MKRRVPQYCPDGTAEGHRIGHPGTPLPTVTPGVLMLSQEWAVFLKSSCHGAGRLAGLTSAWVMAAKSLVSQAICGLCLGSGAVTTHTSATCHFPGVGHAASNLPEPSLQASSATWFFETSLNDAASVPPQPPCANHKPGRPQLSRSRVQASTSPNQHWATWGDSPHVSGLRCLGHEARGTPGPRSTTNACGDNAAVGSGRRAFGPLPAQRNGAAAGKPPESAAGTSFWGCQNLQTTQ